jgi:hypothetical protein
MATDVAPALGHGALFLQAGVPLGYDAIDLRRFISAAHGGQEKPLSYGSYKVSQRAAGANLSVDVAANSGQGCLVGGDSVAEQGLYFIPPHQAVMNEAIAAADVTNPRNDLVVLEALDDTHAGGGLNKSRVRVVTGTPNASAAKDDAYGVNGTPSVPTSSMPLAVVNVPASDTTISDGQISDRRPGIPSIIAATETRGGASYGLLPTPDVVRGVVVPPGGRLRVAAQALYKVRRRGQVEPPLGQPCSSARTS